MTKIYSILAGILFSFTLPSFGQFAPPAGQPGTTAMHMDSSAFINWATNCVITRGYINIADTTATYLGFNRASYGVEAYATGPPDDFVISFGDGGSAILTFQNPISNGPGTDFAVFENGLNDTFLELGFVEVSSDGENYFRFPAISNTQTEVQVATFGPLDATKINNFAGKYRGGYGTPFDLDSLASTPGLDVNHVTHVRIVDVVGCIQPAYASHDAAGHIVNDPWPTPFNTGGFDLDAVGVIHEGAQGIGENSGNHIVEIYPNPVSSSMTIMNRDTRPGRFTLCDPEGRTVLTLFVHPGRQMVNLPEIQKGLFIGKFIFEDGRTESMKIIKI